MGYYEKAADEKFYMYFNRMDSEEDGFVVLPHFHKSIELTVVSEGSCLVKVGEEETTLNKGDMLFVDSLTIHSFYPKGKMKYYSLIIDNRVLAHLLFCTEEKNQTLPMVMRGGEYQDEILGVLRSVDQKWHKYSQDKKWAFMNRFVAMLIEYYGFVEKKVNKNIDIIVSIVQYVEENYKNPISLKVLAQKFGYTEKYFSRLFNSKMGSSLREYINRFRIEKAMELKATTTMSMTRIAAEVGFDSNKTFYRAYKKFYKNNKENNDTV